MIVKVQISLNTNVAERIVLIYDEDHEFFVQLPLSACPGLAEVDRAFYEAAIVDDKIQLGRRLPEQGW